MGQRDERAAKTHGRAPSSSAIEFCNTIRAPADKGGLPNDRFGSILLQKSAIGRPRLISASFSKQSIAPARCGGGLCISVVSMLTTITQHRRLLSVEVGRPVWRAGAGSVR